MSRNTQKADSLSGIEYLSLAVQAASNLRSPNIVIPVDVAKAILALHSPPPLEVTSVSFEEEQRRTAGLRGMPVKREEPPHLRYAPDREGYVGIWKKRRGSNPPPPTTAKPQPPANPPSASERLALRDAGRSNSFGM